MIGKRAVLPGVPVVTGQFRSLRPEGSENPGEYGIPRVTRSELVGGTIARPGRIPLAKNPRGRTRRAWALRGGLSVLYNPFREVTPDERSGRQGARSSPHQFLALSKGTKLRKQSSEVENHGRQSGTTRAPDADRESHRDRDHQQTARQSA